MTLRVRHTVLQSPPHDYIYHYSKCNGKCTCSRVPTLPSCENDESHVSGENAEINASENISENARSHIRQINEYTKLKWAFGYSRDAGIKSIDCRHSRTTYFQHCVINAYKYIDAKICLMLQEPFTRTATFFTHLRRRGNEHLNGILLILDTVHRVISLLVPPMESPQPQTFLLPCLTDRSGLNKKATWLYRWGKSDWTGLDS